MPQHHKAFPAQCTSYTPTKSQQGPQKQVNANSHGHESCLMPMQSLSTPEQNDPDKHAQRTTKQSDFYTEVTVQLVLKHVHVCMIIWATSWQNQQSDCVPSEDSDQSSLCA